VSRRLLDHTADVGFAVEAADLPGVLREAALALTDVMTDLAAVLPASERRIEASAAAPDLLLVDWLGELLWLVDAEGWLLADADLAVEEGGDGRWRLVATARGEVRDPARHPHKVAVKAVTYHGLVVAPGGEGWQARVILDL
jgi:SHS2 domain-containing protein